MIEDSRRVDFVPFRIRSFLSRSKKYVVCVDIDRITTVSFSISKERFEVLKNTVDIVKPKEFEKQFLHLSKLSIMAGRFFPHG